MSKRLKTQTSNPSNRKLRFEDYNKPCTDLAKYLLGKLLCRDVKGKILCGRIVETESYLGVEDAASHSYKGKLTNRNKPMFMKPGTVYVYHIYGMYQCFNISSKGKFINYILIFGSIHL